MNHPFPVICQSTLNKHAENTSGEGFLLNWKKGNEAFGGSAKSCLRSAEETRAAGGARVSRLLYHHAATVQGPKALWRPEGPRGMSPGPLPPTVSPPQSPGWSILPRASQLQAGRPDGASG